MDTLKTLYNAGVNIEYNANYPSFEVIDKQKDYEIRLYKKTKFVCIKSCNNKRGVKEDPVTTIIWKLVKYSQGHNDKNVFMKFNLPVFVRIDEDDGQEDSETFGTYDVTVLATLPIEYQGDKEAPKPNDDDVSFEVMDEFKGYVRSFSGFAKEQDYQKQTKKLSDLLKSEQVPINFLKNTVICISYDPPHKLFNRRNEVMLLAQ